MTEANESRPRGAYWFGQFFFAHPTTGELIASDAHRVIVG